MAASHARPAEFRAMTLGDLARALAPEAADAVRRRLVLEFLEGWNWERPEHRHSLIQQEPASCGDVRYDVLLGALAEHCAAMDGLAGPEWCERRTLETFWFPDNTPAARADAVVRAPAALRRRGIFIAAEDLIRV